MRKTFFTFLISTTLVGACFSGTIDILLQKSIQSSSADEKVSIIVKVKDGINYSYLPNDHRMKIAAMQSFSRASQRNIIDKLLSLKAPGSIKSIKQFWIFNGFSAVADKQTIDEISKMDGVEKVYLNKKIFLMENMPDKVISTLASATIEPNIVQIGADKVWATFGLRGDGVKIGVADTGIKRTHPDLVGKIEKNAYVIGAHDSDPDTLVEPSSAADTGADDYRGHGTHVAGIIAGGNSSGASIGVAPNAKILNVRVFDPSGASDVSTDTMVLTGVEWLISNEAKVINLSLGGAATSEVDPFWEEQTGRWKALGVFVSCAIGNYQVEVPPQAPINQTSPPGNSPSAFGVGAVDVSDNVTSFSRRGPVFSGVVEIEKPDITAPGSSIKSSLNNGAWGAMSGTSMASPHIAGIVALILQGNPLIDVDGIKELLKNTAYKKSGVTYHSRDYGWGRADAFNAITFLVNENEPPVISHVPVLSSNLNKAIIITAVITDNTAFFPPSASVFYRNRYNIWTELVMTRVGSSYTATIPAEDNISDVEYYIKAKDFIGNIAYSPSLGSVAPYRALLTLGSDLELSLAQACPSPFKSGAESFSFLFYLSKPADVQIRIYNNLAQLVKVLSINGILGYNNVVWNGVLENNETASSGVYIYQMLAKDGNGRSVFKKGKFIVLN